MCLTKVNVVKKKEGFGWKIFVEKRNGALYSTDCVPTKEQRIPRPIGEWITATPYTKYTNYVTGFHIFAKKKDAKVVLSNFKDGRCKVYKVQFREARFCGPVSWRWWLVNRTRTIVADQIKILPN